MQITDIRVRKVQKAGSMRTVASITLDSESVVHDIKVIQGGRDLLIVIPSRLSRDGGYRNITHPINSTAHDRMQRKILKQYEEFPEDMIESVEEMVGSGET